MRAKQLLAQDKELRTWAVSVLRDTRFDKLVMYARAELMERKPMQTIIEGAEEMITTLTTMADAEPTSPPFPKPNVDLRFNPRRETESPEKKD